MTAMKDLTGKRFGRLVVLERLPNVETACGGTRIVWKCRCDCGNEIDIRSDYLNAKVFTRSCGCLARDITIERSKTHGMTGTTEHNIWCKMLKRCNNSGDKDYKNYGGRGITVCDRWLKFENFFEDMGNRPSCSHSLDRVDNNAGYCKDNCRWSTMKEQCTHKRTNRIVVAFGEALTVTQWAEKLGVNAQTLFKRLDSGWSQEETISRPIVRAGGYRPKRVKANASNHSEASNAA